MSGKSSRSRASTRTRPNTVEHIERAIKENKSVTVLIKVISDGTPTGLLDIYVNVTNRVYGAQRDERLCALRVDFDTVTPPWSPCVERLREYWISAQDKKKATIMLMRENARIRVLNRGVPLESSDQIAAFTGTVFVFAADLDPAVVETCARIVVARMMSDLHGLVRAMRNANEINAREVADAVRMHGRVYGYLGDERVVVRGVPFDVASAPVLWQPEVMRRVAELQLKQ